MPQVRVLEMEAQKGLRTRGLLSLLLVLFGCSAMWAQAPTLVVTGTGGTTHDFTGSYYGDHGGTPFTINAANPSPPPADNFNITGSFGSSSTTIHIQGNVVFGHTPFNGCPYSLCTWTYGGGATLNISLQGTAGTDYAIDITRTASMSVATADPIGAYSASADSTSVNTVSGPPSASFSTLTTLRGTGSISTSISLGAGVGFRQVYCRASDAEGCLGDPLGYPGGGAGNVDYTLTIVAHVNNQPPLSLSCPAATTGTMNIPYASAFAAFGGTGTFTSYTINTGSLPPGVSLNAFGGVSGTPTNSGLFSFTGRVTDSSGATATSPACSINVASGNCVFMVVPPSIIFDAPGGNSSVSVTTGSGCGWSANSNDLWITINSGSVGNGPGAVSYSVAPNTLNVPRQGTMTIAGQTVLVTQREPNCSFTISPLGATYSMNGGAGVVSVTASKPTCSWTATPNDAWLTSGTGGTGSGPLQYNVASNLLGGRRTGSITIGGQSFRVTQEGPALFPAISVVPPALDFGRKAPSGGSFGNCQASSGPKQMRLVISNVGTGTLSGSVSPPQTPFSIASGPTAFSLAQGQSALLVVAFQPSQAGTYSDSIQVTSNDPVVPTVTVPLSGEGNVYEKLSPVKGKFGQFYYCDAQGDDIEIDPVWVAANIVTISVPVIGQIQVHWLAAPNFTQAFQSIQAQNLAGLVHSNDGLWVPRYQRLAAHIPSNLSNHSWGSAIDINAGTNFFGGDSRCNVKPPQIPDPRCQPSSDNINLWNLVFKNYGFFWGVDFSTPSRSDPAHFEVIP